MQKILLCALAALLLTPTASHADEGMWLMPFIKEKNIEAMKKAGFKLSAEDIFSVNNNAIKDAIIIFGRGCTGEIISPQGLVITNHHCGYDAIQQHSSVENDYLKNGFWAAHFDKEIPTPGLTATFVRRIEDVTKEVLNKVTDKMDSDKRSETIAKNIQAIEKKNNDPAHNIRTRVMPMFGGNQYILFVEETFGDVRMVGAPPSSIGKFGGEQDNWMWPRHTGDFSMFRIYATQDGKSTKGYDKTNTPYNAPKHLSVSSKGIKEGDYAMIIGFPGSTTRYMTTWEIDQMLEQENPIRIDIRGQKQKLMWEDMTASDAVRIKYAAKYAYSSNFWKNSIGKSRGLKRLDVRGKKQAEQDTFTAWVNADPTRIAKYGQALAALQQSVTERRVLQREAQITSEVFNSTEAISLAANVNFLLKVNSDPEKLKQSLVELSRSFFKDYNAPTDKKVTKRLLEIYQGYTAEADRPAFFAAIADNQSNWVDQLFANSIFANQAKFEKWIENPTIETIQADPAFMVAKELSQRSEKRNEKLGPLNKKFAQAHRLYLAGLLEINGDKAMYPDANFTMRMTYGNVLPYKAADAVNYDYYTTLDGVMEKENADDPEFVVPAKLKELHQAKDYGRWANQEGQLVTCFLSSNDITGGNSGSGVLNDKGELIGLAFDGNWEAMSGDVAFEPVVQRTINMDIRYVLFIIDKFAGAQRLLDEMTIL